MRKFRPLIATLIAIGIIISSVAATTPVLRDDTVHGVMQCLGMYEQPKDSIDVLMLGSSHVHYGINTAKLWNDYGISAYDYSSAEQSMWVSYHYLLEACKNQKPKIVVLDFFSAAAFQENHKFKYHYLADSLNGMKFSANKLQLMEACFDGKKELWNKFYPAYFGYHDRYDTLTEKDFKDANYDYTNFKGFTPYFEQSVTQRVSITTDQQKAPQEKTQVYLKKIIDYTKKNGIKLYITIVPYQLNVQQTMDAVQEEDKYYNWLAAYLGDLQDEGYDNVFFDYTFGHLDSIGLDYEGGTDFYDESHLNYYGSCKFTDYLAANLRNMYSEELTPDHRGDPYYSSWDVHVEEIKTQVSENGYEWR